MRYDLPSSVTRHHPRRGPDYGDRFEDAIRLIEAEARKPEWGWASCSHDHTVAALALPES
jgi:hypothetical protein